VDNDLVVSEPTSQLNTTPDPDLEPGQQVGEYVVDEKIGEGAFGTVFRATHPLIGKVVAIKVLARRFSVDPDMVSRFVAEAKAVNQIRHRNIIDIFSFGALEDGRRFYVMEYLDGETLDARVEREGKLTLAEAIPILRGIARALDAAHAKGIAHRDLKAENVFLAEGDGLAPWPKLLDFGIAKLMATDNALEQPKHKTRTGTPVGTPYYMSPEQCRGRDVDHRTDYYAFGVLAYLLVTGKYPHDAADYMSILMRQLTEHPDPPSSLAPELPPGIDETIGWLIAKDPADRPPDLRTAVAAFETAAEEAGIPITPDVWDVKTPNPAVETRPPHTAPARSGLASKPPSSPAWSTPRPRKTPRSRRRLVAVIGGAVALAAAVVVIVVRPWDGSPEVARTTPMPPAPTPGPAPAPIETPVVDAPPRPLPEIQTVIINVTGVPEGTEVLVGGMTVGAAPGPVQLPRDANAVVLVFKADGYKIESHAVTPDHDQTLDLSLKKKPVTRPVQRPSKDDIIDVFKHKP